MNQATLDSLSASRAGVLKKIRSSAKTRYQMHHADSGSRASLHRGSRRSCWVAEVPSQPANCSRRIDYSRSCCCQPNGLDSFKRILQAAFAPISTWAVHSARMSLAGQRVAGECNRRNTTSNLDYLCGQRSCCQPSQLSLTVSCTIAQGQSLPDHASAWCAV